MYPFAVVLFFSIVPIILSVDHFLRKASEAADGKAKCEGKVTGKITSAVDCRKAIRAANAGTWVNNDMKGLFEQLRVNTRIAWFCSDLARNFLVSITSMSCVMFTSSYHRRNIMTKLCKSFLSNVTSCYIGIWSCLLYGVSSYSTWNRGDQWAKDPRRFHRGGYFFSGLDHAAELSWSSSE